MQTRMIGLVFSIIWLVPLSSYSQEYRGISVYSILHPKFPCRELRSHIQRIDRPAVSILFGTFGSDTKCLKSVLDDLSAKPHLLEVHISNESARRMKRPFAGEILPDYSVERLNAALENNSDKVKSAFLSRWQEVTTLLRQVTNENTQVAISLGLEDNYSKKAFHTLFETLSPVIPPWYGLVRSSVVPISSWEHITEVHRDKIKTSRNERETIVNPDGYVLDETGYRNLLRSCSHCSAVFYWSERLQGRRQGKFTPPRTRRFMFSSQDRTILKNLFR